MLFWCSVRYRCSMYWPTGSVAGDAIEVDKRSAVCWSDTGFELQATRLSTVEKYGELAACPGYRNCAVGTSALCTSRTCCSRSLLGKTATHSGHLRMLLLVTRSLPLNVSELDSLVQLLAPSSKPAAPLCRLCFWFMCLSSSTFRIRMPQN